MKLGDAYSLTMELMAEHGLLSRGWTFGFDDAEKRFGVCYPKRQRIQLSRALTFLNEEKEVRDTILHEIAHALCPSGEHHGRLWQQTAVAVGCEPTRCYDGTVMKPPQPFIRECTKCGSQRGVSWRNTKSACARCCRAFNGGIFTPQFRFRYRRDPRYVEFKQEMRRSA